MGDDKKGEDKKGDDKKGEDKKGADREGDDKKKMIMRMTLKMKIIILLVAEAILIVEDWRFGNTYKFMTGGSKIFYSLRWMAQIPSLLCDGWLKYTYLCVMRASHPT